MDLISHGLPSPLTAYCVLLFGVHRSVHFVSGTASSLGESRSDLSVPGTKLDTMDIQVHKMLKDHWKNMYLFSFALRSSPACFPWYVLSSGQRNLGKDSLCLPSGSWKIHPSFHFQKLSLVDHICLVNRPPSSFPGKSTGLS